MPASIKLEGFFKLAWKINGSSPILFCRIIKTSEAEAVLVFKPKDSPIAFDKLIGTSVILSFMGFVTSPNTKICWEC